MIVETGAGLPNANSYASEADLEAYAEANGATFTGDAEVALVAATAYLDGRYRRRYPGEPTHGRAQALEWPRAGATDTKGRAIPSDEVPREIVKATIIAALQHLRTPGSLYPVASGTSTAPVKRKKLGPMEVEYDTTSATPVGAISLTAIDDILGGLLGLSSGGAMVSLVRA